MGKNVGVTDTGGFAQTLLQACLAPDNVDMKSVKQINMQRSGFVPSMVTNRISAAIFHADGAYTILNKMPNDTKVLAYESQTLPLWWYGALATNEKYAKEHAPEVKRFLRALIEASRWMQDPANRAKAIADGTKASGEDPKAVAYAFDLMIKNHIWPKNEGLPSKASYEFTAGKLKDFGQIDKIPPYDATIDPSFVNDVLKVIGKVPE